MSLRTWLLGLTVLLTAGIVMLVLRHPRISARVPAPPEEH